MELTALHFDVYQRYEIVLRVVRALGLPAHARILDVGGYPGTLLDCLAEYYCVTADTALCRRTNYVCASGCALPFVDKSFDAVVTTDTLEHVAPPEREVFVGELMRLAQRWVIIAAPFDSRAVRFCDEKIAALHQTAFDKTHAWLAEHIAQGLPQIEWLTSYLARANLPHVIFSNGYLMTWFLLRGLEIILEIFPDASRIAADFHPIFNRLWSQSESGEPSYRKVFLVNTQGNPIPEGILNILPSPAELKADETQFLKRAEGTYDLLRSLIHTVDQAFSDPNRLGATITTQYIKQLENATHFQEEEVRKLRSELQSITEKMSRYDRNLLVRIMRRLGWI